MNRFIVVVMAGLTALLGMSQAWAQTFPSRPIKIVSGYPPGGNNDTGARIFAKELERRVNQPVIVENKPGAGGTIGTRFVAQAAPDGYTLLFADIGSMSNILSKNGLDVFKELVPVSLMLTGSWVLYVTTKHPVKTFQDLVAYAKTRPPGAQLNLGATNIFSTLAVGVLKKRTGIDFVNVPYKGQAPVALALASGDVDLAFDSILLYKPLLESGKLRALFVTRKSTLLPDVPTAAQAGVPDFEPDFQGGMWAPVGTPKDIIAKLSAEFAAVVAVPGLPERVRATLGSETANASAEALRLDAEIALRFLAEAARIANFQPE